MSAPDHPPSPLPWPFAVLDRRHAALLADSADLPWEDGQPARARAWYENGALHLRRGRAHLRLLSPPLMPPAFEAFVRAAVGADARALWPALAKEVLMAEGGRIFLRERLPATMTYGTAIVAVVDGDPQAWAAARDLLRLPDPRRPVDLRPLPDWIHVEEDPDAGSAHLRLRRRAALAAHGLRPLARPGSP